MIRRTPVKKRRQARRGPWRSLSYRKFIAAQPCLICGDLRTQAAHTKNNGRSSKGPDSSCVPLCVYHHDELDGRRKLPFVNGRKGFEGIYHVNLEEEASIFFAAWSIARGAA